MHTTPKDVDDMTFFSFNFFSQNNTAPKDVDDLANFFAMEAPPPPATGVYVGGRCVYGGDGNVVFRRCSQGLTYNGFQKA
jgi:hypothetical protein